MANVNYISAQSPYGDWTPQGPLAGMMFPQRVRDYQAQRDISQTSGKLSNLKSQAELDEFYLNAPVRGLQRDRTMMDTRHALELGPQQQALAKGDLAGKLQRLPHENTFALWQATQKLPAAERMEAMRRTGELAALAKGQKFEDIEQARLFLDLAERSGHDVSRWRKQIEEAEKMGDTDPIEAQWNRGWGGPLEADTAAIDPNNPEGHMAGEGNVKTPTEVSVNKKDPFVPDYGRTLRELQMIGSFDTDRLKHIWDLEKQGIAEEGDTTRTKMNNDTAIDVANIHAAAPGKESSFKEKVYNEEVDVHSKVMELADKYGVRTKDGVRIPDEIFRKNLTPRERAVYQRMTAGHKQTIEEQKAQLKVQQGAGSLNVLQGKPSGVDTPDPFPGTLNETGKELGSVMIKGQEYKVVSETENEIVVMDKGVRRVFRKPKKTGQK